MEKRSCALPSHGFTSIGNRIPRKCSLSVPSHRRLRLLRLGIWTAMSLWCRTWHETFVSRHSGGQAHSHEVPRPKVSPKLRPTLSPSGLEQWQIFIVHIRTIRNVFTPYIRFPQTTRNEFNPTSLGRTIRARSHSRQKLGPFEICGFEIDPKL